MSGLRELLGSGEGMEGLGKVGRGRFVNVEVAGMQKSGYRGV
jgi:hypothetical protein